MTRIKFHNTDILEITVLHINHIPKGRSLVNLSDKPYTNIRFSDFKPRINHISHITFRTNRSKKIFIFGL